ncbi:MAG: hypothetical protein RLZ14_2166 [Actinomycetota bacterium]
MPDSVARVNAPNGPAGWFPDPVHRYEYRYYNGVAWTADVAVNGQRSVDPMGAPVWNTSWSAAAPGGQVSAAARRPGRGRGIASFVVGLVSLLAAWMPFVFVLAAIGAVVGLALGISGLRQAKRAAAEVNAAGNGYAVTGIVLSALALPMCIVGGLFTGAVVREVNKYLEPGSNEVSVERCDTEASTLDSIPGVDLELPRRVDFVGSIRNLETDTRSYTVLVEYRLGTKVVDTDLIAVAAVKGGASATFEGTAFVTATSDVDCVVTDVFGPQPFNLPIDQPAEVAATQASYIRE